MECSNCFSYECDTRIRQHHERWRVQGSWVSRERTSLCFCFLGSRWRGVASSSLSGRERSQPFVHRRGSRCGPSTSRELYWACSRPPALTESRRQWRRLGSNHLLNESVSCAVFHFDESWGLLCSLVCSCCVILSDRCVRYLLQQVWDERACAAEDQRPPAVPTRASGRLLAPFLDSDRWHSKFLCIFGAWTWWRSLATFCSCFPSPGCGLKSRDSGSLTF